MLKKMVGSAFCLLFLSGCDNSEKVDVVGADQQAQQAEQKVSKTAIYFPGGAGIDFRRKPIFDKIIEDELSRIRIIQYKFDEPYDLVDKSVASIFLRENYLRKENPLGDLQLSVSYIKEGVRPVLAKYKEINQEGVGKKTVLTVSWRL